MAKIKVSPLVKKIQGSVDGLLFSSSRGVPTVRRKVTPANPNTSAQQISREALTTLMGIWAQVKATYFRAFEYGDFDKNQTLTNRFLALVLAQEMIFPEYSMCPHTSTPDVSGPAFLEGPACHAIDVSFSPSPVPTGFRLFMYHRVESAVAGAPPVMTRYTYNQGTNSPVSVPLVNCEDGENFIYGNLVSMTTAVTGFGFGNWIEFI